MAKLVLGLDIGITSVGYGVIDIENTKIVDYGVRLFKEGTAEENETRRTIRSRRRLIARKKNRLQDMANLLTKEGIMPKDYEPLSNVYEIRQKGLSEKLTPQELTSALLHITKHRGSTIDTVDDSTQDDKELGELKDTLQKNAKALAAGKYICEIQLKRLAEDGKVRGHSNNFKTEDYLAETKAILVNQELSEDVKQSILKIIQRKRAYYEGPGSEKSPTPYGRFVEINGQIQEIDLIDKMRGKCSIYPDQLRAPKMSVSADLFNFLNDLNNLKIDGEKITVEQKEEVMQLVDDKGSITLKQLAKLLEVAEENIEGYRTDSKCKKAVFTEFKGYKLLKKLFKEQNMNVSLNDYEMLDEIIEILTKKKGIEERKVELNHLPYGLSEELINNLSLQKVTGYHSLSLKAIRELNVELWQTTANQMQLLYQLEMLHHAKGSMKGKKNIVIDEEAILSPVAKRAQNETFKVINALRKKYGEFDSIVVETTRDKNSVEQKSRIKKTQAFYEAQNKQVDKLLEEAGYDLSKINSKTKMKVRLYLQQEGKSAYTLQPLVLDRVIRDDKYTEIDHIIPISISLDDSFHNKCLTTHAENQAKGNMTPLGAYQSGKFKELNGDLSTYISFVKTCKEIPYKKKNNLLYEKDITKFSVIQEFISRNLVDTSYANRVVMNTLSQYFSDNEIPTKVHTVRGALTDKFRRQIQMQKDRDEDFLHHAIDALIVASIKKLNLLNSYLAKYTLDELYDDTTGELIQVTDENVFLNPKHIQFIKQLRTLYDESNMYYNGLIEKEKMYLPPIKISHKIDTKPNRQVADETIYSTRKVNDEDMLVEKIKDIYDPKLTKLTDMIVNGEEDKFLMAQHDPQTFAIIKDIVMHHFEEFKDSKDYYSCTKKKTGNEYKLKGENPLYVYMQEFGPIRKYSKKGNGPEIHVMKYLSEKLGNHICKYQTENKKVILKQISPYRTDFYLCRDGKYRFVTVRYKDVLYKQSIKKYVIDKEWYEKEKAKKKIDEQAAFQFSMHRNELIGIVKKSGEKYIYDLSKKDSNGEVRYHDGKTMELLKFTATNNDMSNRFEVKPIFTYCSKQLMPTSGTIVYARKYATDVLGNLYEVKDNRLKLEFE